MKDFRGIKRQRSRNRKAPGNSSNPNRAYESNGPDGAKVRGNAQTIYEKYQQLARDANSSGDRVLAENHLQHAEHYFRLIRQTQPQRPISEYVQRDPFMNGFDIDYDDETETESAEPSETETTSEAEDQGGEERSENRWRDRDGRDNNRDRNSNNRDRNNNNRDNRDRDRQSRDNGPRDNRDRDQNRDQNRDQPREYNREANADLGDDGNRRETRRERYERRRQQRLTEQEVSLNTTNGNHVETTPSAGGFGPSSLISNAPAPFIASTEPLGGTPARNEAPEAPKAAPRGRAKAAAPAEDLSHLPAFLRAPTNLSANEATGGDEAAAEPAKRARKPRRKADEVAEDA